MLVGGAAILRLFCNNSYLDLVCFYFKIRTILYSGNYGHCYVYSWVFYKPHNKWKTISCFCISALSLYRKCTVLWFQNRGTNQNMTFLYCYTPNKYEVLSSNLYSDVCGRYMSFYVLFCFVFFMYSSVSCKRFFISVNWQEQYIQALLHLN